MHKVNKKSKNITVRNMETVKKRARPLKEWNSIFAKAIESGEKPEADVFEGVKNITENTEWKW